MLTSSQVEAIILNALKNINEERDAGEKMKVSSQTKLFGVDSELDSLGLVTLVTEVETEINDQFGTSISLMDDRAMAQKTSPFSDVQTLRNYIVEIADSPADT
jgi:acyl carrier protein